MVTTDEQFEKKLIEMINRKPASDILQITKVYELVAEAYNNAVFQELYDEHEDD